MKTDYFSFLLRLWAQNHQDEDRTWRASIQSPDSGKVISFSSIAELTEYLEDITANLQTNKTDGN
jgi:hypothetical protein